MFETWSQFTSVDREITATPFSCETKLSLTIHRHEGEEIVTEFSFLGELSLYHGRESDK